MGRTSLILGGRPRAGGGRGYIVIPLVFYIFFLINGNACGFILALSGSGRTARSTSTAEQVGRPLPRASAGGFETPLRHRHISATRPATATTAIVDFEVAAEQPDSIKEKQNMAGAIFNLVKAAYVLT
jgi:hypothetical protein